MDVIFNVAKANKVTAGKDVQQNRLFLGLSSSKCMGVDKECLYIRIQDIIVRLSGDYLECMDAKVHAFIKDDVCFTDLRYVKARLEVLAVTE